MKIYKIYKNNELYAWTAEKDFKDLFLLQRNQKIFTVKKVNYDESTAKDSIEEKLFMNKYSSKKLVKDVLSEDVNNFYDVVATIEETTTLDSTFAEIYDSLTTAKKLILSNKDIIKDKYVQSMLSIIEEIEKQSSDRTV